MTERSAADTSSGRVGRRRWMIGVLLGAGVVINYFDRISLSVAAPQLESAFGLRPSDIGLLFSAFFWSYALLQIPGGMCLDRFGVARVGRWGSLLWAIASALTAAATGFVGLFASRCLLGVAEAPSFPANAKATGYWFPRRERALATAIFDAAAKFSNVIGVPLIALVVVRLGWRWGFAATAVASAVYFALFYTVYRDPSRDRKLSAPEREYIRSGGALAEGAPAGGVSRLLGYLLRQRKVWGLTIGFAAYGYTFYLFLTWLPAYLVTTMHLSILTSAMYAAIPWLVATVADLVVGGWLIDFLIARGRDESKVRQTVLLVGMALGLATFGATQTTQAGWAIFWISLALGGLSAAAPVGWSLPSLVAPRGGAATIGSIMNFANNLMGAAAPWVTGYLVGTGGSFSNAFAVACVILLVGLISFAFVLGRIEPIAEPTT